MGPDLSTCVRWFRFVGSRAGLALLLWPALAHAGTVTTTTLTLSSSSVAAGTAVTLTANVLAGAVHVHPGTVVFCNASATTCSDAAIVGRAQLTSSGTAAIKIVAGLQSHSYKAIFQATNTYNTSTSSNQALTVTGYFPTTTTYTSSGSAGAYTLTATTTSYSNLPSYPYGTMNFQDLSNGNYVFGTGSVGSGSYAEAFVVKGTNTVPAAPRRSVSADFNGDGNPDLAVSSQNGNSLAILLGNGDGTFTAASGSPISTGSQTVAAAAGDFNGDGNVDLAVAVFGTNTIVILLGNGDGTFTAGTSLTGFNSPDAVAIADLDKDGNLDLAVTSQNSNVVCDYLGNGAGGFTVKGCTGTGTGPYSVVAADLNGDGKLDLVVGNASASSVTVLLGDGTGGFTAATGSPVTVGTNPWNLVAVDLNGDGKVDIVASDNGDANLSYLLGNGNGTFATYSTYSVGTGQKEIAAGDFNGDGNMDVAVCSYGNSTLTIALGNGSGYFYSGPTASLGASGCAGMALADFDGDGLTDVEASLQGNSTSTVMINQIQHSASATFGPGAIPGHGSHNIVAYYPQDFANAASSSASAVFTATPSATTLTLSTAPGSSTYSQQVAISATLSPYIVGSETTAGETITFYKGGSSIGTANLTTGVALLNVTTLPAGTNSLTAAYPSDLDFNASTSSAMSYVVSKATPVISWTAPSAITYGTALSGTQLNATSGGVAGTFAYTPASGTVLGAGAGQTLSVTFTPTDTTDYNSASGSTTITVNKATPVVTLTTSAASAGYSAAVTFTATLTAGVTGTVTFLDSGSSIGTGTISGTTATFTTSSLPVGSHTITAAWPGNTNYTSGTSAALTETIVKSSVTVVELSSLNPSIFGDSITLSISVTGGGATPTGTVTLTNNGAIVTTLTLSGSGTAAYTTSVLTAGSHALTLTYNGDGSYF